MRFLSSLNKKKGYLFEIKLTSLMFLVLICLSLSEEITLCFNKTLSCPDRSIPANITLLSEKGSLSPNNNYRILTDADFDIDESNMPYITSIIGFSYIYNYLFVNITRNCTLSKLEINNAELDAAGGIPDLKIDINELTLNKRGSIIPVSFNAPDISIKKLKTDSIRTANKAIEFSEDVEITDNDAVCKVSSKLDSVEIQNCDDNFPFKFVIPETCKSLLITSYVSTSAGFLCENSFESVTTNITINLEYGNIIPTFLVFGEMRTLTNNKNKLTVNVNTYYFIKAPLSDSAKDSFIFNPNFVVYGNGAREKIPVADSYCFPYFGPFEEKACSIGSQLLWDLTEVYKVDNADLCFSAFEVERNIKINFNEFKNKSVKFIGLIKKQVLSFTFPSNDEGNNRDIGFDNIEFNAYFPSNTINASLTFRKLLLRNTSLNNKKEPTNANIDGNPAIMVNVDDLTTDVYSFMNFNLSKPMKSFTIFDVKSANFPGDAMSASIDGSDFDENKIPTPFTIQSSNNDEPIKLTISKNEGSLGRALPFSFNVTKNTNMTVEFIGDWSLNEITVNVAEGGNFIGIVSSKEGSKGPILSKAGSGSASLNGEEIQESFIIARKTSLSGGAIAGIVIGCIVVVACIAITAFLIIKKRRGANDSTPE